MRTSLVIPEDLVSEAKQVSGAKTNTGAIILALTELVQRRKSRHILQLKGSLRNDYDYKSLRRKR